MLSELKELLKCLEDGLDEQKLSNSEELNASVVSWREQSHEEREKREECAV